MIDQGRESESFVTTSPIPSSTTESQIVKEEDKILEKSPIPILDETEGNYDDNNVQTYDSQEEYEDDGGKEITDSNEIVLKANKTYDVVTMKPVKSVKDDNFKEFMDNVDMDDAVLTTNSNEASEVDVHIASPEDKGDRNKKVVSVVSVVTTKSVVNNTVIGKYAMFY